MIHDASLTSPFTQQPTVAIYRSLEPAQLFYVDTFRVSANSAADVVYVRQAIDTSTGVVSAPTSDEFSKHFERLREMMATPLLWPQGADGPTSDAYVRALFVLQALRSYDLAPSRVSASAEGGIAICFARGSKYSDIECLNSGDTLGVNYDRNGVPDVWEIGRGYDDLALSVTRIRKFIL